MSDQQMEQQEFQPKLGLIGALIGLALALVYGTEWYEFVTPAALGFVLGGAAPVFKRVWLQILVVVSVLAGATWLIAHYL